MRAFLLIVTFTCFVWEAHAERMIDRADGYAQITANVGLVFKWGLWLDQCVGDPQNVDFKAALTNTFSIITKLTGNDDVRSKKLIDAGTRIAIKTFREDDTCDNGPALKRLAEKAQLNLQRFAKDAP